MYSLSSKDITVQSNESDLSNSKYREGESASEQISLIYEKKRAIYSLVGNPDSKGSNEIISNEESISDILDEGLLNMGNKELSDIGILNNGVVDNDCMRHTIDDDINGDLSDIFNNTGNIHTSINSDIEVDHSIDFHILKETQQSTPAKVSRLNKEISTNRCISVCDIDHQCSGRAFTNPENISFDSDVTIPYGIDSDNEVDERTPHFDYNVDSLTHRKESTLKAVEVFTSIKRSEQKHSGELNNSSDNDITPSSIKPNNPADKIVVASIVGEVITLVMSHAQNKNKCDTNDELSMSKRKSFIKASALFSGKLDTANNGDKNLGSMLLNPSNPHKSTNISDDLKKSNISRSDKSGSITNTQWDTSTLENSDIQPVAGNSELHSLTDPKQKRLKRNGKITSEERDGKENIKQKRVRRKEKIVSKEHQEEEKTRINSQWKMNTRLSKIVSEADENVEKFSMKSNQNRVTQRGKSPVIINGRVKKCIEKKVTQRESLIGDKKNVKQSFEPGDLIIGHLIGYGWWFGKIVNAPSKRPRRDGHCWVYWFGDHRVTEVGFQYLEDISMFPHRYNSHKRSSLYIKAVKEVLMEAAKRTSDAELPKGKSRKAAKQTLSFLIVWAMSGFQDMPSGNMSDGSEDLKNISLGEKITTEKVADEKHKKPADDFPSESSINPFMQNHVEYCKLSDDEKIIVDTNILTSSIGCQIECSELIDIENNRVDTDNNTSSIKNLVELSMHIDTKKNDFESNISTSSIENHVEYTNIVEADKSKVDTSIHPPLSETLVNSSEHIDKKKIKDVDPLEFNDQSDTEANAVDINVNISSIANQAESNKLNIVESNDASSIKRNAKLNESGRLDCNMVDLTYSKRKSFVNNAVPNISRRSNTTNKFLKKHNILNCDKLNKKVVEDKDHVNLPEFKNGDNGDNLSKVNECKNSIVLPFSTTDEITDRLCKEKRNCKNSSYQDFSSELIDGIKFNFGEAIGMKNKINRNHGASTVARRKKRKVCGRKNSKCKFLTDVPYLQSANRQTCKIGDLILGKLKRCSWFGKIISYKEAGQRPPLHGCFWVFWFGDHKISEMSKECLEPLYLFPQRFIQHKMKTGIYKRGVQEILFDAARRVFKTDLPVSEDNEDALKLLIDWAMHGFQPSDITRLYYGSSGSLEDVKLDIEQLEKNAVENGFICKDGTKSINTNSADLHISGGNGDVLIGKENHDSWASMTQKTNLSLLNASENEYTGWKGNCVSPNELTICSVENTDQLDEINKSLAKAVGTADQSGKGEGMLFKVPESNLENEENKDDNMHIFDVNFIKSPKEEERTLEDDRALFSDSEYQESVVLLGESADTNINVHHAKKSQGTRGRIEYNYEMIIPISKKRHSFIAATETLTKRRDIREDEYEKSVLFNMKSSETSLKKRSDLKKSVSSDNEAGATLLTDSGFQDADLSASFSSSRDAIDLYSTENCKSNDLLVPHSCIRKSFPDNTECCSKEKEEEILSKLTHLESRSIDLAQCESEVVNFSKVSDVVNDNEAPIYDTRCQNPPNVFFESDNNGEITKSGRRKRSKYGIKLDFDLLCPPKRKSFLNANANFTKKKNTKTSVKVENKNVTAMLNDRSYSTEIPEELDTSVEVVAALFLNSDGQVVSPMKEGEKRKSEIELNCDLLIPQSNKGKSIFTESENFSDRNSSNEDHMEMNNNVSYKKQLQSAPIFIDTKFSKEETSNLTEILKGDSELTNFCSKVDMPDEGVNTCNSERQLADMDSIIDIVGNNNPAVTSMNRRRKRRTGIELNYELMIPLSDKRKSFLSANKKLNKSSKLQDNMLSDSIKSTVKPLKTTLYPLVNTQPLKQETYNSDVIPKGSSDVKESVFEIQDKLFTDLVGKEASILTNQVGEFNEINTSLENERKEKAGNKQEYDLQILQSCKRKSFLSANDNIFKKKKKGKMIEEHIEKTQTESNLLFSYKGKEDPKKNNQERDTKERNQIGSKVALPHVEIDAVDQPLKSLGNNGDSAPLLQFRKEGNVFKIGDLVIGKLKRFNWWFGKVVSHKVANQRISLLGHCWVCWFGDHKVSEMSVSSLEPLSTFPQRFLKNKMKGVYKRAVQEVLNEAATRCSKIDLPDVDETMVSVNKRLSALVDWALNGFQPFEMEMIYKTREEDLSAEVPNDISSCSNDLTEGIEKLSHRKKQVIPVLSSDIQELFNSVAKGKRSIEKLCLACGDTKVVTQHPLFEGGLCKECKENFIECTFMYDNDGYQMYCTICSDGDEIILCDEPGCCRSYCPVCIDMFSGIGQSVAIAEMNGSWKCFMCTGDRVHILKRRDNWQEKLKDVFQSAIEYEHFPPMVLYDSIPYAQRKPIRVLALFDGIGTGYLVLKKLDIQIELYVASEIDEDATKVTQVRHGKNIKHVGDVRNIYKKELDEWGPFDLLIGGSPCNDLSIANPLRKGIYEGTGRLFFEYYRILQLLLPHPVESRPFFWLFENVVGMRQPDREVITRFLQCPPTLINSKIVSPQQRSRYFWGNLPGMNRQLHAMNGDKVLLQDCLEPNCGRIAKLEKVRCITTMTNSLKQTKKGILPIQMRNSQISRDEDGLWLTEIERIFGFPEHYTDVGNMGQKQRQKLLGKSWCVPVMRHIFAPLRNYFKTNMESNEEEKRSVLTQTYSTNAIQ